jgi:hypothetical protein
MSHREQVGDPATSIEEVFPRRKIKFTFKNSDITPDPNDNPLALALLPIASNLDGAFEKVAIDKAALGNSSPTSNLFYLLSNWCSAK